MSRLQLNNNPKKAENIPKKNKVKPPENSIKTLNSHNENKGKPPLEKRRRSTSETKEGGKILTPEGQLALKELKHKIKTFKVSNLFKKSGQKERPKVSKKIDREIELSMQEHNERKIKEQPNTSNQTSNDRKGNLIPSNAIGTSKNRKFQYTEPIQYDRENKKEIKSEIVEISNERVLSKRPRLETIRDLSEVGLLSKISLVNYFNAVEKGKIEERKEKEEYKRNSKKLQKINSLKYFILESSRRNLETRETPEIILHIDPSLRDELYEILDSKLLSSYEIKILKEDEILTKLKVEPIEISIKLKTIN